MRHDIRPDLIIHNLESSSDAEPELSCIKDVRARFEGVKSVILVGDLPPETLLKAAQTGIEAILSKEVSVDVLQRTLELVMLGQHLLPGELARLLLESAASSQVDAYAAPWEAASMPRRTAVRPQPITLSRREHQILLCLVEGLPNKVIARELDITEATVKVHVKGLLRKTQMTNRTQAAIWALNNSLSVDQTSVASLLSSSSFDGPQPTQTVFQNAGLPIAMNGNS
jgi:two-component system nitrate/nitrite response regulator NarL